MKNATAMVSVLEVVSVGSIAALLMMSSFMPDTSTTARRRRWG